jgi:putative transposase
MEALGYDKDHIHLLCGAHPKMAPCKMVQIFKSITVQEIFLRKPQIKKALCDGESMAEGNYVTTIGERSN